MPVEFDHPTHPWNCPQNVGISKFHLIKYEKNNWRTYVPVHGDFFFYLLEQYRKADVYFLEHMIKSDKNWVNDISRETKIDSIIWKHSSLINLTTQIQDSTKYLMSNGFYDAKGMLQMNLMLHGQTVNISWNTKQIVGSYSAKQTEWRGQLCQKMSSCSMTMPPKKKKKFKLLWLK